MKMPLRRGLVATAVTALGVGLLATPAAQADTSRTPQTVNAADWLAGQVVDGVLYNDQFDFADWGLTIDALLALDAVGGYNAKTADIRDALADDQADYTSFGGGATAKTLVAAQTGDVDGRSFGGTDLVAATEGFVDDGGSTPGALRNQVDGTLANTFSQSFAAKGLAAAESSKAGAATDFLLLQQCADGGFRLDVTAAEPTCIGAESQTDATSVVVNALLPQQGDAAVEAALERAGAYLLDQREADGSLGGGPSTTDANTNSTALAAIAFEGLGEDDAAARAAAWIAERQVTAYSACGTALDGEFGAVAYDDAAIATAEDDGIEVETVDQWRRATAPAVTALQSYDDPAPAPKATFTVTPSTANGGWVGAGGTTTVSVTGLAAGERYCVYTADGSAARAGKAAAEGPTTITVKAPAAAGNQPVVVYGSRDARQGTGTLKVLGARTLGVKLSATKIKRNGTMRVTVSGLAVGEPVKIGYGGKFVATGTAGASKTATLSFKVGSATGTKRMSAQGVSAQRYGSKTFTVVK